MTQTVHVQSCVFLHTLGNSCATSWRLLYIEDTRTASVPHAEQFQKCLALAGVNNPYLC